MKGREEKRKIRKKELTGNFLTGPVPGVGRQQAVIDNALEHSAKRVYPFLPVALKNAHTILKKSFSKKHSLDNI